PAKRSKRNSFSRWQGNAAFTGTSGLVTRGIPARQRTPPADGPGKTWSTQSPLAKALVIYQAHYSPAVMSVVRQKPMEKSARGKSTWIVCSALFFCGLAVNGRAPAGNQPPKDPLIPLLLAQPRIEIGAPVTAVSWFDPPVVRPGQLSFFRITIN